MELVRVLRPKFDTIKKITHAFEESELCWICRHVVSKFCRMSYVVRKYCENCKDLVDVLDHVYPLSTTDDPIDDPDPPLIVINKEQVTDWSECDVCLYKVAKQDTLSDHYESYANPVTDRACAWCVALLGLSMPGQKPLEYYCYSSSSSSNSGDECEDRNYQLITGGGNEDKSQSDESDESDIEFVSPSSAPM